MKLTILLLTAALVQVHATGLSQTVTYSGSDVSLEKLFKEVEKQTGFVFFYDKQAIKKSAPVTVNANNTLLEEFLESILAEKELKYRIENKNIFISKKIEKEITKPSFVATVADPIKGIVQDTTGQRLSGATVTNKRTKKSVQTNAKGEFIIEGQEGDALVITFIGYGEAKYTVSNDMRVIVLSKSVSPLDEIQIMAYGRTSRRLNTGNISTVTAEEIESQPVSNPLLAIMGKVPGLLITQSTGLTGGKIKLNLRGARNSFLSLNRDAQPLIVVDGLPIAADLSTLGGPGALEQGLSALSFMNPNDIASIDVLKDADATSIYGSRGSAGVILITTKTAKPGQTLVTINAQSGLASMPRKLPVLNTEDFIQFRKDTYASVGRDISQMVPSRSNADVTFWDQNKYTDWQKTLFGKASISDILGTISGGNSSVQYILGGNYHKENSIFPGNTADTKASVRMSLQGQSANQKFKAIASAMYLSNQNKLPGIDLTEEIIRLAPNTPDLQTGEGKLNWAPLPNGTSSFDNPLSYLYNIYEAAINNLMASADLSYKLFPFLTVKTQVGYNIIKGSSFKPAWTSLSVPPEVLGPDLTYSANYFTSSLNNVSVEPMMISEVAVGEGKLQGILGGSFQSSTSGSTQIAADGFTNDALMRNWAAANSYRLSNASSEYKYVALWGRVNYTFRRKFILNLSARRDGSSRFGPQNQFGNFWAAGSAWIFSEEKFAKTNLNFLSFGKLRASYGTSGNDGIGDYMFVSRFNPVEAGVLYQNTRGYQTTGLANSHYHWETTKKLEAALELGFLADRVFISGVYFRNRSDDQLMGTPLPSMVGPGSLIVNSPLLIQNSGVEFTLTTENVKTRSFRWTTAFNFSRNRNKLIKDPTLDPNSPFLSEVIGKPFYGVVTVYNYGGIDPENGLPQFKTSDGRWTTDLQDPELNDGYANRKLFIEPNFFGGFSNSLMYKGFSLDLQFQYVKKVANNYLTQFLGNAGRIPRNVPKEFLDRWQKIGDVTQIQKIYFLPVSDYLETTRAMENSTFNYVDASFIRLKNISLSYQFPEKLISKWRIKNLNLFVHGQNVLTITSYKGLDPETAPGLGMPPLKVFTVGLRFTL